MDLPLADRMAFIESLQESIMELEPMLWDDQHPANRQALYGVIQKSRHALQVLNNDVLPRYSPTVDYEDKPPGYAPFVRLPVSTDRIFDQKSRSSRFLSLHGSLMR